MRGVLVCTSLTSSGFVIKIHRRGLSWFKVSTGCT